MTTKRAWHFKSYNHRKNAEGRQHIALGVRVGYWPCLHAPYIQLALWRWRVELWHGLPSKIEDEYSYWTSYGWKLRINRRTKVVEAFGPGGWTEVP